MQSIRQMRMLEGVHVVKFDFCMLGMLTADRHGKPAAAKKRITVMTNSPAIATLLREAQCRFRAPAHPAAGGKSRTLPAVPGLRIALQGQTVVSRKGLTALLPRVARVVEFQSSRAE